MTIDVSVRNGALVAGMVALAAGCTITRDVRPVSLTDGEREVCIVEDPAVREGFLQAYRGRLEQKGYAVRVLPKGSPVTACPVTSTYMGRWSWDLAIYLNYAEIIVYRDGAQIGRALYDGRRGGGRVFDKFGNGEKRIHGLVDELFPR